MTSVSDDLNRADDPTGLGTGWLIRSGAMGLASGMAYPVGTSQWAYATPTTVMATNDAEVSVTLGPTDSGIDHFLLFVGANTSGECVFAYFYQGNAYFWHQYSWSSYYNIQGASYLPQAVGDTITLRRNGTVHTILKNGVDTGISINYAVIPIDSSHLLVGFGLYSESQPRYRTIDAFSAKDTAVSPALSGGGTLSATVEVVTPPSGFAPTDLSGCTVWLDASQLGLTDGQSLGSAWPNLGSGGDGNILLSPAPVVKNNAPNGKPVVRFTANQGMVRGDGMCADGSGDITIMYVGRMWGSNLGRIFSGNYFPHSYNFLVGTHVSGNNCCYDNGWVNSGTGFPAFPNPWTTWGFTYTNAGNISTFFVDGTASGTATSSSGHDSEWNLSGYSNTEAESCDCEVAELVCYDRALTTTEREQVEDYLTAKWFAPPPVPVAAALSGSGTLSATVEVASAWGPDERTIIDSTPGNLYAGDYTIGTRFTANADGRITHIRAFLGSGTHTFSFWDAATQTKLTTSVVETFSGAADHRQVALTTPVSVVAGTSYVATASVDGATYGYTTPIPTSLTSNITLAADMMYGVGSDVFPTNTGSGYHNHVDVIYQEYLGTAPPSIPVSADLSGSGTLSASVTESYSSAPALGGSGSLSATVHKWASPADTPGLGLWLDASALTGLSSGDPVTTWSDASGAGRHATAIDAAKPLYRPVALNAHPAVDFAGGLRRMNIPGWGTALSGKTEYTLFYVAKVASFGYSVIATAPPDTIWRWLLEYEPSGGFYWGHGNGYFRQYYATLATNTPYALTFLHTTSGPHYYINGSEAIGYYLGGSGDIQATVPNVDGDVILGAYYEGSYPVDGVIAEFIWYDHALTTAERLQVEGYLNEKYFGTAPSTPISVGFSGGGSLGATAAESYSRSISLGGDGTLSATVMKVAPAAFVLTGSGALSAAAIRRHPISAALSGSGSLSATVKAVVPQAASLAGTGTLSATLSPIRTVAVGLAGTGTLLATVTPAGTAPSSPGTWTPYPTLPAPRHGGGWTASPVAVLDPPQRGWLGSPLTTIPGRATGTGQLTVTITARRTGYVLLAGDGQLTASVFKREYRPALLAGDGQPSASYSQIQQCAPQFFGLGTLYGVPISELAFPEFAGGGEFICYIDGLSAIVCPGYSLGVNFTGGGTLAGDYDAILRLNMTFAGQGLLSATFSPKLVASLTGSGALSASVLQAYLRTAALLASGSLSATDFAKYLRSIGFTAPGDLTALFLQLLSPPAGGDGTISAQVKQIYSVFPAFSGGGTLTAFAGNQMSPAFNSDGTLTATTLLQYSRPTGLSGYGALLVSLWALYQRSTAHGGTGTLSVTPSQLYTLATTPLSGGGTLSGSTVAWYYPAAALSGGGSLAVSGVFASYQQAASLSGGGTLSATATKVPIPTITNITTAPFHVGDTITLTGTDFSTTTGMTVGGVAVTEGLIVNDTTMTIVIPAGVALGAQNVVVIAASGASAPYSITIVAPPATITTVSPSTGHRETAVTITGTNFIGVTSVTIGGQAVTNLSVVNTTTITCNPPGLANATYDVVVATSGNGTATKTSGFTYSFTPISETNTARTNQARPAGTSGCWVTLIGAGGGAGTGHGAAFTACGGGGGGGGAGTISRSFIAVASLGSTYSVVRPTGSTAAGAATSFTSGSVSLSANGGGKGGNGGSGTAGTAGAAGTTTVSGATVTSINGAAGAAGAAPTAAGPAATNQTTACPGGGGGGGRTGGGGVFAGGKGGNSSFATGGSGGSSGGGTGGTGGNASPLPGNPGAGGGGGGSANGTGGTGGPAGDYGAGGGGGGGGNSTGPAGAGGDGYSLIEWV